MPAPEPIVNLVARAVLDGAAVDWDSAASHPDPDTRAVVEELRLIAGLAAVHREGSVVEESARQWSRAVAETDLGPASPGTWSHLKILEPLGRGASGAVYRAWDPRLDREVALKLFPAPRAPATDAAASALIEEGRLLARVRHPNVVTIHGAEQIGGWIGLWMELVPGRTLEALLAAGPAFGTRDVIAIGVQLCEAAGAVHDAGLLHRDIKATNVMRTADGRIVLMDFGAGRDAGDGSSSDLTGTPLYLAPEVFRGAPATVQSDLYSLGVLLYRLLARAYPVTGATISDVRDAHARGDRARLRAVRADAPAALVRVIERATDPSPAARFPDAHTMGAALRAIDRRRQLTRRAAVAAAVLVVAVPALSWLVRLEPVPTDPAAGATPPRVAVLRFTSAGSSADDEAFGLGLAHEIQRGLARLEGMYPISFTSSSLFPADGRSRRETANDLGADLLLEGSVLRAGGALRVDARLVRAADEATLWEDTFDRTDADVPSILDEISAALVERLRLTLRWARRHETRADLIPLVLKARAHQARRYEADTLRAAELFQQVVSEDRSYAPAWAGLANALAEAYRLRFRDLPEPPDARIEFAARTALALDPLLPDAHTALGNILADRREWVQAEQAFRHAIELNPSVTSTHMDYAIAVLMPLDRNEPALALLAEAIARDPRSADVRRMLAHFQVNARRYDEALRTIEIVRRLEREQHLAPHPWTALWHGRALALSNRSEEALAVFEADPNYWPYLGYTYARMGRRAEADALIAAHPDDPRGLMMIFSGLDDKERAIAMLERLAARNAWRAATWLHRPEMDAIRGDPRVEAIKAALGLTR